MLDVAVGMQGEDGGEQVGDVLALPGRDHHAGWHVLACFGRGRSGQCRAMAIDPVVRARSLCIRDARRHGETTRERPGRGVHKGGRHGHGMHSFRVFFSLSLTLIDQGGTGRMQGS